MISVRVLLLACLLTAAWCLANAGRPGIDCEYVHYLLMHCTSCAPTTKRPLAAAQRHSTGFNLCHALCLYCPDAGNPLPASEVNAIIAKAQEQLGSKVTPGQIAQLKQSLSDTPADVFSKAAQAAGVRQPSPSDVMSAASAAAPAPEEVVWKVIENGLRVGATSANASNTNSTGEWQPCQLVGCC